MVTVEHLISPILRATAGPHHRSLVLPLPHHRDLSVFPTVVNTAQAKQWTAHQAPKPPQASSKIHPYAEYARIGLKAPPDPRQVHPDNGTPKGEHLEPKAKLSPSDSLSRISIKEDLENGHLVSNTS